MSPFPPTGCAENSTTTPSRTTRLPAGMSAALDFGSVATGSPAVRDPPTARTPKRRKKPSATRPVLLPHDVRGTMSPSCIFPVKGCLPCPHPLYINTWVRRQIPLSKRKRVQPVQGGTRRFVLSSVLFHPQDPPEALGVAEGPLVAEQVIAGHFSDAAGAAGGRACHPIRQEFAGQDDVEVGAREYALLRTQVLPDRVDADRARAGLEGQGFRQIPREVRPVALPLDERTQAVVLARADVRRPLPEV